MKLYIPSLFIILIFLSCNDQKSTIISNDISNLIFNNNSSKSTEEYVIHYTNKEYISSYSIGNTFLKDYFFNPKENEMVLIDDTVYKKNNTGIYEKYTGIIRVVGDLKITNEFLKEQAYNNITLCIFSVKNGLFIGNQLYYTKKTTTPYNGEFFLCEIKPFMDAQELKDFVEVDKQFADLSVWLPFQGRKYYKILSKDTAHFNFKISKYWENGNLYYSRNYTFKPMNFIKGSLPFNDNLKEFTIDDTSSVKIFHYNGSLAFEGHIKKWDITDGVFYTFDKRETDLKHFKLQSSFINEVDFQYLNNIPNDQFKQYRQYFGIKKEKDFTATKKNEKSKLILNTQIQKDIVCGMPLEYGIEDTVVYQGKILGFCSLECKKDFLNSPSNYTSLNK